MRWDLREKSHELTMKVYDVTARFPEHERTELTRATRRAGVAVASNIVQGRVDAATDAANDLKYHLLLTRDLGHLPHHEHKLLAEQLAEVKRMLTEVVE